MTIRRTLFATLAVLALAATGCTQTDSGEDTAALSAEHEHGPPGPDLLLQGALDHLDLTAEQRTAIESAARTIGPPPAMHQALLADVAAGVRAGQIDEAKLLAKLDAASPRADRTAALAQALDTLHATLTADQRRALVDQIAKHMAEHMAEHAQPHAAKHGGADAMIEHLVGGLDLTSEQRASIDAIVAAAQKESDQSHSSDMAAVHADLAARLQTFASDRFDAAGFAGALAASPLDMNTHVQRALHVLAQIVPVLTPAQRDALATRIESMAMMHGH